MCYKEHGIYTRSKHINEMHLSSFLQEANLQIVEGWKLPITRNVKGAIT